MEHLQNFDSLIALVFILGLIITFLFIYILRLNILNKNMLKMNQDEQNLKLVELENKYLKLKNTYVDLKLQDSQKEIYRELIKIFTKRDTILSVIDSTLDVLLRHIKSTNIALLWVDNSGENLTFRHSKGYSKLSHIIPIESSIAGNVFKSGNAIWVDTPIASNDYFIIHGEIKERNLLCIPFKVMDTYKGVIRIANVDLAFKHSENLMKTVVYAVTLMGYALDKVIQSRNIASHKNRLEVIHKISKSIETTLDREKIIKIIIKYLKELYPYSFCNVLLINSETNQLLPSVSIPRLIPFFKNKNRSEVALRNLAKFNDVKFILNPQNDKNIQIENNEIGPILLGPLFSSGNKFGTIVMVSTKDKPFEKDLVGSFRIILEQIGDTLERAEYFYMQENYATKDGLTNLYNHRMFQDIMDKEFDLYLRHSNRTFSMILLDIDFFKKFNDSYSHQTGDIVLRKVSQIFTDTIRKSDVVFRYGGEEFTVILPSTSIKNASILAERIRQNVEKEKIDTSYGSLSVTISLGVAEINPSYKSKIDFIEICDKALYATKESGRNGVTAVINGDFKRVSGNVISPIE